MGQMVRMINGILNVIERDLRNGETRYEDVIEHGGADHLVCALEMAQEADLREKEEALAGIRR